MRQDTGESHPVGQARRACDGLQLGPQRTVAHHRQGDVGVAPGHLDEGLHESPNALDLFEATGEEPPVQRLGGCVTSGHGIDVDRIGKHTNAFGVFGQCVEQLVTQQATDTEHPVSTLEHLSVLRQTLRVGQQRA